MLALPLMAETTIDRLFWKHEVRIGWGDQLFESLMWHNPNYRVVAMPAGYTQRYAENYHYDQHLWFEYQYRLNRWFSFGCMADASEVHWDHVWRDGQGVEKQRESGHFFYNLVLMPTIRFTYFHHPNVNLYSGLGLGLDINGGSEEDAKGKKTAVGAAVNVTVFGVSANYDRWFWTVDFGGLSAMQNANTVYLLCSRMINVGFGARF